ncbi:MAG: 4Fe-4S single cluster domain-containing protein, partial [Hyphomicrobiaceae bacterium]
MSTETRVKHLLAHDTSGDRLTLNVHAIVPGSRANGPGLRTVVWLQGCSRRCPGCFNPETHDHSSRRLITASELVRHVQEIGLDCEGISVSGGEPLEQSPALLAFLRNIREQTSLSIVLFSGYTFEEMHDIPHGPEIVAHLDVLIAGRFVRA